MFMRMLAEKADGATSIEYALIATIISIASIGVMQIVGVEVIDTFELVGTAMASGS